MGPPPHPPRCLRDLLDLLRDLHDFIVKNFTILSLRLFDRLDRFDRLVRRCPAIYILSK